MQGSPRRSAEKPTKKPAKKRPTKKATTKVSTKATANKSGVSKKAVSKKVAPEKAVSKKVTAKKPAANKAVGKKAAPKKPATKMVAQKKAAPKRAVGKKSKVRKGTKEALPKASKTTRPARRRARPMIGWREWVVLPEFSATPIKAKVDTGAVTSAIHAFDLQLVKDGEQTIARFGIAPKQGSHAEIVPVSLPVVGFKQVRSSNGQAELRPVIRTNARIGSESFEIDITLASRDSMGFRMLLGRKAMRSRFWVDPGRSFLQPHDDVERGEGP